MSKICKKTCGKCPKAFQKVVTNCAWSSWSKWSSCSKSCGKGWQKRSRSKLTIAQNGGKECAGKNKDKRSCNKEKCPGIYYNFTYSTFFTFCQVLFRISFDMR